MAVQIFTDTNNQEMVILPKSEYLAMEQKLDAIVFKKIQERDRAQGIPHTYIHRVLRGENPIKVYRDWRGLTQNQLAEKVGVSTSYITNIENEKREGTIKVLKVIAETLDVDLEDLLVNL